jgi:hypothetical protein
MPDLTAQGRFGILKKNSQNSQFYYEQHVCDIKLKLVPGRHFTTTHTPFAASCGLSLFIRQLQDPSLFTAVVELGPCLAMPLQVLDIGSALEDRLHLFRFFRRPRK